MSHDHGLSVRGGQMAPEGRFTLNPRVSVFRQNEGVYLFDAATRTCASMNEAMLALLTGQDHAECPAPPPEVEDQALADLTKRLHALGLLLRNGNEVGSAAQTGPRVSNPTAHLAIFVTTKCNLRCAYCYANGGDSGKTIDRDTWRVAMDYFFSTFLADSKSADLSIHGGGEATVEFSTLKEIVADVLDRACARGLRPSINMGSNGTYGEEVHRWVMDQNIGVNISLDGPPQAQNLLRPFHGGQPSYDVVERNLKALVAAGRRVSVRVTVTDSTLEWMEETIRLASELGVATVHFEPVSLAGRCASAAVGRPDAEQFATRFLRCFLLGLELDVDATYSGLRCFAPRHQRFCSACGQNFCVTPDGDITTCFEVLESGDPAASSFFIGKVDPVKGQVSMDQSRIEGLKQRVTENMEACRDCFLKEQCAGDCLVRSFRYSTGDLYRPDPYRCRIAELINKQLIVWLSDGVIEHQVSDRQSVIAWNRATTVQGGEYARS